MTDKNKTELVVILDRSGSMSSIRADMEGGFKTFIREQAACPGELVVSLFQFDSEFETVFQERPAAEVSGISLVPRGGTALHDAVGKACALVGERLAARPEHLRPGAVVVLVITDGQENSSREYSREAVRQIIERQEKEYSWKFSYLGSELSSFQDAASIGIPVQRRGLYAKNTAGIMDMYTGTSEALRSYRQDVSNNVAGADLVLGTKK